MEKVYFIVNPNAKNGSCRKIWRSTERQLQKMNIPFLAFFTEYPGHAKEIAEMLLRKAEGKMITIAAVGGDGTMHEVVNGTAGTKNVILGFIPGGSGNDFSRGFDIPNNSTEALKLVIGKIDQLTETIDVGKITHNESQETYFMNNMGVGFDAVVAGEANHSKVKKLLNRVSLGSMVYAYILIKKLLTFRCVPLDLVIDGRKYTYSSAWFATVSNQPYYGGGMKIAPAAKASDGLLDVTIVHQISRWKLLAVFISVFWGKHTMFKEVEQFTGRSISITSPNEIMTHADGEVIGNTPLHIQAFPRALKIISGKKNEGNTEELRIDDCH